jgi:hypothetical protein
MPTRRHRDSPLAERVDSVLEVARSPSISPVVKTVFGRIMSSPVLLRLVECVLNVGPVQAGYQFQTFVAATRCGVLAEVCCGFLF